MPTGIGLALPWQLSPTVVLAVSLAAILYARGMARVPSGVPLYRRIAFFAGLVLLYAALQTSWDYYASHMFSVLQLQHFALHDLAPALLCAAAPGAALARGLPRSLHARLAVRIRAPKLLLDPRVATLLYVVSFLVWLWPPVTFDVMVSNRLYEAMSWSTFLGALPFWSLAVDPRDYPHARLRLRHRFALLYIGMLPMMLMSAALAFSHTDWYPVYAVCGRFLPISPVEDQELAGLAMWVPGGLLFGGVFIAFLGRRFDRQERALGRPAARMPGPR
ncbi:MAG TPA: cytochrome c oxidase assembly protein [Steroidobacteraceae bacterium]|nr:cytochrome c oxidase assembly protein [Steroidobacteraceae bacterium]